MTQLANPHRIVAIILCLLSDYIITVNTHICEVGREQNQHNEWKWVLPYPDSCKCTNNIMGGMNTWTPIRPFVPKCLDSPLLSDNIIVTREHYGRTCKTGTTPNLVDTSPCSRGLRNTDSSAVALDTATPGASISPGEESTTNYPTANEATTSAGILFSSQGKAEHTSTTASGSTAKGSTSSVANVRGETNRAISAEAGTLEHAGTAASAVESRTGSATRVPSEINKETRIEDGTSAEHAGTTASVSSAVESITGFSTSVPSETSEATSTEAGTSKHAGTTTSGSTAVESSTGSATSVSSETSEATSTQDGTSKHAGTTASGSTAVESSTSSATGVPSETSEATSTEDGTSEHAGTTASGSASVESSTSSATGVPSKTSAATSTEDGTSDNAGTTASGSTTVESSTNSATSIPSETSEATSTKSGTSIRIAPTSGISTSRSKVCNEYLGMENGDIPDDNIVPTANSFGTGRLNTGSYWTCNPSVCSYAWIQADIGYQTNVSGVITQGDGLGSSPKAAWVTSLKVSTFKMTTDDQQVFVSDENGNVKVFQANTDRDTPVTSEFANPVYARVVRITGVSKNTVGAYWQMRFEIMGCKQAVE